MDKKLSELINENERFEVPFIQFQEVDDIWIRYYSLPKAGTVAPQHAHEHDHITLICSGTIVAFKDDEQLGKFEAPAIIIIPAKSKHAFVALTDNVTLACLHNLRGTELEEPKIFEEHVL